MAAITRRSPRQLDPFRLSECDLRTRPEDQRTVANGLGPNEKMSRFRDGPPIFGSTAAFNIATGPPANNPHDLSLLVVRLHGNLAAEDYENHYRLMLERSQECERRGILGTGIVNDMCVHDSVAPGVQRWMMYRAVYPRPFVQTVAQDPQVLRCRAGENRRYEQCVFREVPSWAKSAISANQWSQADYDNGIQDTFYEEAPDWLERDLLGDKNVVFIIDNFTSIDLEHSEFKTTGGQSRILAHHDFYPVRTPGFVNQNPNYDENHGMCCAIMAAGLTHGVASGAFIVPVNVYKEGEPECYSSDVVRGLEWVRDQVKRFRLWNRAVVNVSLSFDRTDDDDNEEGQFIEDHLVPLGVVVVVSAGNRNLELSDANPLYPQMDDSVLTVGGMNEKGEWWGDRSTPGVLGGSNYGACVRIVAPAADIPLPVGPGNPPLSLVSGTSLAAPLVAGLAACIQDGRLTRDEVVDRILDDHTRPGVGLMQDVRILAID
ncbi:subtilisin-like protein [Ascobolus immersus RN42]|uniref:Subtilisin-like protein n=1 Tax=Ascobolus immersus RN42 TaxID=1160509 RepID=A0A3N4IBJ0_ASCIM|nr:subtilisin-like protein [Ascobolus immersus RN42]